MAGSKGHHTAAVGTKAPAASSSALADGAAWVLNVSTSVVIVFVNKQLMDAKRGHGFSFGAACACCVCARARVGGECAAAVAARAGLFD